MENIVALGIEFVVAVVFFLVGRYVWPNLPKTGLKEKLDVLYGWAACFVPWAKKFLDGKTGEEKMAAVIEELRKAAEEAGWNVTDEQLRAIAQTAYDAMKAGEEKAKTEAAQPLEAVSAAPIVNVYANAPEVNVTSEQGEGEKEKPPEQGEKE